MGYVNFLKFRENPSENFNYSKLHLIETGVISLNLSQTKYLTPSELVNSLRCCPGVSGEHKYINNKDQHGCWKVEESRKMKRKRSKMIN